MPGLFPRSRRLLQESVFPRRNPVCIYGPARTGFPAWKIARRLERSLFSRSGSSLAHLPLLLGADGLAGRLQWFGSVRRVLRRAGLGRSGGSIVPASAALRNASERIWNPRQLVRLVFRPPQPQAPPVAVRRSFPIPSVSALCFLLVSQFRGCSIYEAPVGGGEVKQLTQVVKIQKYQAAANMSSIPTAASFSIHRPSTT